MIKKCRICKTDKEIFEFSYKNKEKEIRSSYCKECNKTYQRSHYQKYKKEYLIDSKERRAVRVKENQQNALDFLLQNPCIDCAETDPMVLDFDHLRDKKKGVCQMITEGYSWKTIKAEIAKCVVRCANCHRRKTMIEFGWFRSLAYNANGRAPCFSNKS